MIKVIKRVEPVEPVYKRTCFKCTSELEYGQEDIKTHSDIRDNSHEMYIDCPVCNYRLKHHTSYSV